MYSKVQIKPMRGVRYLDKSWSYFEKFGVKLKIEKIKRLFNIYKLGKITKYKCLCLVQ